MGTCRQFKSGDEGHERELWQARAARFSSALCTRRITVTVLWECVDFGVAKAF